MLVKILRLLAITLLMLSGSGITLILGVALFGEGYIEPIYPLICSAMGFSASGLGLLTEKLNKRQQQKDVEQLIDAFKRTERTS